MTDKWVKDTGEVFALVLVLFGFIYNFRYIYFLALIVLLITTTAPALLRPLAFIWLKFTQLLAIVMPKIFFGLVFYVIITPIGLVRKIIGYDSLNLNNNHKKISSFITRNHLFTKTDLNTPY